MVYNFNIDKTILGNPDLNQLENILDKIDSFLSTVNKRSFWVDCDNMPMHNQLSSEIADLLELIEEPVLNNKLQEIYFRHFYVSKELRIDCKCENIINCNAETNVKSINKIFPYLNYFITSNSGYNITPTKTININSYKDSELYKECLDRTAWEGGIPSDNNVNIQLINRAWEKLFQITKKITILDRNVFSNWNDNYEIGLKQFYEAIRITNKNIKLRIITKFNPYVKLLKINGEVWDKYTIRNKIEDYIKLLSDIKIEFCLTEHDIKIDHDRFILFDELIGALLNRGLDTFVSNSSNDNYRVIYFYPQEVKKIMKRPEQKIIDSGDFKPIKNY